jgi:hypothetical protein
LRSTSSFCLSLRCVAFFSRRFPLNLSSTNPRLHIAAWCMCSRGSLGFGCVVSRYACAATNAASGVSCTNSSSSSSGFALCFLCSFLLLSVLLSSCCASGLCASPCWTMMNHYIHPNILHLMCFCNLGFL